MAQFVVCLKRCGRNSYELRDRIEEALKRAGLAEGLEVHIDKHNLDENGVDVPEDIRKS